MTRHWRTVLPFMCGIVSFGLLALFNEVRDIDLWRNYAISGVVLGSITTWAIWNYDVRIPHYIQWVIVGALLLHYGGGSLAGQDPYHMGLLGTHGVNGAYHTFHFWDHVTHGAGIGAGAMALAYMLDVYQVRRNLRWTGPEVGTLAVLSALAAGVGVELYEYAGKTLFQTIDQGGYVNTVRDLHYNLLGALVGGVLAVAIDRRRLWPRIEEQWQRDIPAASGLARFPMAMRAYLVFVGIPAFFALAISVRYFFIPIPVDDTVLYDPTLRLMTWGAVLGIVGGLGVSVFGRQRA